MSEGKVQKEIEAIYVAIDEAVKRLQRYAKFGSNRGWPEKMEATASINKNWQARLKFEYGQERIKFPTEKFLQSDLKPSDIVGELNANNPYQNVWKIGNDGEILLEVCAQKKE